MPAGEAPDDSERLPEELRQPFKVALAKAVERLADEGEFPGDTVYEPKWDGFSTGDRARRWRDSAVVAATERPHRRFPEIVDAAERRAQRQ